MADAPMVVERSVEVACAVDHAFATWTTSLQVWWPLATHSFTRSDAVSVTMEPFVGGRIVEVARDGSEHAWGTVCEWDPPRLVRYTWHLGFTPETATDVAVRFEPIDTGRTRVTVTQTGFERLGPDAERRHAGNAQGWEHVLPYYRDAAAG